MPSAKQIKARKLFAKRVKRGDFRKAISKTKKSELPQKNMKAWLKTEIKMRTKNPKNFSSDYSRGELRGYKEALAKLMGKRLIYGTHMSR